MRGTPRTDGLLANFSPEWPRVTVEALAELARDLELKLAAAALSLSEADTSRRDAIAYLAGVALGAISYAVNSGSHSEAMLRVREAQDALLGREEAGK